MSSYSVCPKDDVHSHMHSCSLPMSSPLFSLTHLSHKIWVKFPSTKCITTQECRPKIIPRQYTEYYLAFNIIFTPTKIWGEYTAAKM